MLHQFKGKALFHAVLCLYNKNDTESCPSGRRCSTRNAVWGNSPRVRIPNSPPQLNTNFDTMCFKVGVHFLFVKSPEIGVFLILFNYSPFYRAQNWSVESGFLFFIIKLLYDTSWGVCIFRRGVCIFGKGGVHLLIICHIKCTHKNGQSKGVRIPARRHPWA